VQSILDPIRVRLFNGTASRSYGSRVIDGRKMAQKIEADVKKDVELFVKEQGIKPALATILVGNIPHPNYM